MLERRWERIEQLFNEAISVPLNKRVSFVEQVCGADNDLCFEVVSLLEADKQSDEVLEQSVFPLVAQLLDEDFSGLLEKSDFASYKLKKLLGRGGMGAVFLAEDTRLERFVALKILPSTFDNNSETARRFQQEAKAVSVISHQNVAHIYEFGEYEGMCFFAMEYVPGKTLRDSLDEKEIKISDAVEIALQIAHALGAAHAEDITHRDIKPENIMLRQRAIATGEVLIKVLDFGLAKLGEKRLREGSSSFETMPGLIMGTTAYMSPEQVRGEAIDERTDLWSLGVVLYEMIDGKRPFKGNTASDVHAAILMKEPSPLALEAELPELSRIVKKALEKDVTVRYQSAREIIHDLRSLQRQVYDYLQTNDELKLPEQSAAPNFQKIQTDPNGKVGATMGGDSENRTAAGAQSSLRTVYTAAALKGHGMRVGIVLMVLTLGIAAAFYFARFYHKDTVSSIAVLPFVNAGGDPNTEYLSDGISESLINNLSQLPNVKVIARSSSFKFKGKEIDPREVANTLGAQAIITGKIAQLGDQLVVTAEMINAADNTQIWGGQYNRKILDLLHMQSEISQEIAIKLRIKLTGAQEQKITKSERVNPQAYEMLLKGRFSWNKGGTENRKKAIEYYKQAVAIDQSFALAYADLSIGYILLVSNGILDPHEFTSKASEAANKALELDPDLADAHLALAWIKLNAWEWSEAEREYKLAIELSPNLSRAHNGYAYHLSFIGRHNEAIAENKRAKNLDPISLVTNADAGNIHYLARQYDQGLAELENALELDPNFATTHVYFGYIYAAKGMYQKAIAAYRKAIELTGETTSRQIFLGAAYAKSGELEKAKIIIRRLESEKEYVSPGELAILYSALGESEKAFASLEKAFTEHDLQLQYLKVDPAYDSLRPDPRFQNLLRRVGFTF